MHDVCSPDQVPDVLVVARVSVFAGPRQLHSETGVLSAIERATSYLVQGRPFHFWQAVQKVCQHRFRIVQILNGDPAASPLGGAHKLGAPYSSHRAPQRVRLRSSLASALLDSLFEQPAAFLGVGEPCWIEVDDWDGDFYGPRQDSCR